MIGISIFIGIFILTIGGAITYACFDSFNNSKVKGITALTITFLLIIAIVIGTIWYYNNTESGKREIKDMKSNTDGGITRVVTVYDINGKEIQKYEGKFDVAYDSDRIKFDDEQGKRHIIYYTTGTITIDEK